MVRSAALVVLCAGFALADTSKPTKSGAPSACKGDGLINCEDEDHFIPGRKREPCPNAGKKPPFAQLDKCQIQGPLSAIKDKVNGCFERYGVPGIANVLVTVARNGTVAKAVVTGRFADTRTGDCVESVVKQTIFEPFTGAPMTFTYPYLLRSSVP